MTRGFGSIQRSQRAVRKFCNKLLTENEKRERGEDEEELEGTEPQRPRAAPMGTTQ